MGGDPVSELLQRVTVEGPLKTTEHGAGIAGLAAELARLPGCCLTSVPTR